MTVKAICETGFGMIIEEDDQNGDAFTKSFECCMEYIKNNNVDYVCITDSEERQALVRFLQEHVDPDLWYHTGAEEIDGSWPDFVWLRGNKP